MLEGETKAAAYGMIQRHTRYRCSWAERPIDLKEMPITYPKFKSPYWQKPKEKNSKEKKAK